MAKQAKEYISNPFTLSFRAFGNFTEYNMGWFVALLIIEVLNISSNAFNGSASNASSEGEMTLGLSLFLAVFAVLALIAAFIITVYFYGMFSYVSLKSAQQKKVTFKEAFRETKLRFKPLALGLLNAGFRIIGGLFLFIIPGIRAILRYSVLPYAIMSQPAGRVKGSVAVARSKEITKSRLMEVFGVLTMSAIPLVGSSLTTAGGGVMYNQLTEYHDKKLEKPSVHWLNYIGFIVFGAIVLTFATIFALVALTSQ